MNPPTWPDPPLDRGQYAILTEGGWEVRGRRRHRETQRRGRFLTRGGTMRRTGPAAENAKICFEMGAFWRELDIVDQVGGAVHQPDLERS